MDLFLLPGILFFLLLFLILLGFLASGAFKLCFRAGKSPADLWLYVLTGRPCVALLFGILFPSIFGITGLAATRFSIQVNLDFGTYLEAELEEQQLWNVAIEASRQQTRKVIPQEVKWNAGVGRRMRSLEASKQSRRLQFEHYVPLVYQLWKLEIFYEALDPERGVFTEEALTEIRDFERQLVQTAGYSDFCRRFDRYGSLPCDVPSSVTNLFFTVPNASGDSLMDIIYDGSGSLANIESTLRLLAENEVRWWTDSDFNGRQMKSRYTRSTFYGGAPLVGYASWGDRRDEQEEKIRGFFGRLFEDYLLFADREGHRHVKITWFERRLQNYETMYYLWLDMLFAFGTLATVLLLILMRLRNLFVVSFAGLGVALAFIASFYFHHVVLGFESMTVLDFVSFFVILGIAADDVFLMHHAYEMAPAVDPRSRMLWAFKEAGAAMLVTSVTTCGSFYANNFSVIKVVRSFGSFMACLVAWNYINVMTIFSAALLVNDLYIIPFLGCRQGSVVTPKEDGNRPRRGCMSRFSSCIQRWRRLFLSLSVALSIVSLLLGVQSFRISEGIVELFEEDVNLGRLQRLRREIFPDKPGDYEKALSLGAPGSVSRVRACPGRVNDTWCSGQGLCDTVTSSCLCVEPFVGQACSRRRGNGTAQLVYYSLAEVLRLDALEEFDYLYVHVLASPLLSEVPPNVRGRGDFFLLNDGDTAVEWRLLPPEVPWLSVSSSGSTLPPRSFSRSDQIYFGRDSFQAFFDLGRKPAFWSGNATLYLHAEQPQNLSMLVVVVPPAALSKLLVFTDVALVLRPPFSVSKGFEGDMSRNLVLEDVEIVYEVTASSEYVMVDAEANELVEVWVDGALSLGPTRVELKESREIPIQVVSLAGTTTYTLVATRDCGGPCTTRTTTLVTKTTTTASFTTLPGATSSTRSTSTSTLTATQDYDTITGTMTLEVLNCGALLSPQGTSALGRSLAEIAEVQLTAVRVDFQCKRQGNGRRLQIGAAELRYAVVTRQRDALGLLRSEDERSMTQKLQASVDEEGLLVQLEVLHLEAPLLNAETTTTVTLSSTRSSVTVTRSSTSTSRTSTSRMSSSSLTTSESLRSSSSSSLTTSSVSLTWSASTTSTTSTSASSVSSVTTSLTSLTRSGTSATSTSQSTSPSTSWSSSATTTWRSSTVSSTASSSWSSTTVSSRTVSSSRTTSTSSSSSTWSATSSRTGSSTWSSTSRTVSFLEEADYISGQVELLALVCDVDRWLEQSLARVTQVELAQISVESSCQPLVVAPRRLESRLRVVATYGILFAEPMPTAFKTALLGLESGELQGAMDAVAGEGALQLEGLQVMTGPEPTTTRTLTTTLCPGSPSCMGKGRCVSNASSSYCACEETYSGLDCSQRVCPVCNLSSCLEGRQDLDSEWRCDAVACPGDCNGGGDCDNVTGRCTCLLGFAGPDCGQRDVPLTNAIEIILVFGLKGYEKANRSAPDYDGSVDLLDPLAQAHMLEACQGAREMPMLKVKSEQSCWIEGFKRYLQLYGGDFPTEDRSSLETFMYRQEAEDLGFDHDVRTSGEFYDGELMFSRLRMKVNVGVNAEKSEREILRTAWEEYVRALNSLAPPEAGAAWMVSFTWNSMAMEDQVFSSTLLAFSLSMLSSLLSVSCFTQNLRLALYVCLTILLVVSMLAGCLLSGLRYDFGVVEAIGATIFVGLSVDYCLHLAHGFHYAPGPSRAEKLDHAVTMLAPSIGLGALTTIAACAFLLPCRMILFRKLGWTLVLNASISLIFTYSFLAPLLLLAGPRGRSPEVEIQSEELDPDAQKQPEKVQLEGCRLGKSHPLGPLDVECVSE